MAAIDSRNARLASYTEDVEDIKTKIKNMATNANVSIVYGTDTPLSVLSKVESKPIEISTAAGMSAVLIAANVGKVYKFTGTTDANYTNGDLYEVEEVT